MQAGLRMRQYGWMNIPVGAAILALLALVLTPIAQAQTVTIQLTSVTTVAQQHDTKPLGAEQGRLDRLQGPAAEPRRPVREGEDQARRLRRRAMTLQEQDRAGDQVHRDLPRDRDDHLQRARSSPVPTGRPSSRSPAAPAPSRARPARSRSARARRAPPTSTSSTFLTRSTSTAAEQLLSEHNTGEHLRFSPASPSPTSCGSRRRRARVVRLVAPQVAHCRDGSVRLRWARLRLARAPAEPAPEP